MKLHQTISSDLNLITGYGDHYVKIAERTHSTSLIVTPHSVRADWRPCSITALTKEDLESVLDLNPEVVLLGTGLKIHFPHPKITTPLIENAVGLEVMDTAAACRTYNILASEGREIAAALIIEPVL